jgi:hypothetical protein
MKKYFVIYHSIKKINKFVMGFGPIFCPLDKQTNKYFLVVHFTMFSPICDDNLELKKINAH